MTWFNEDGRTFLQKLAGNVVKCGPIPQHVAIIMDGNRRFAKNNKILQIQGHISGFDKLTEALSWCFAMEIREVTVYAFSIENFKRSKAEINDLFNLAKEKFEKLLEEEEKIQKLSVCIRVLGDLSMVPDDLANLMAKVMANTKDNQKCFLNICFAYTSREEMTQASKRICDDVRIGCLRLKDIDDKLVDKYLYTLNSLDVDLLVRTSGEVRLSDFLLWQSNKATITFVEKLWPEFNIWNFYMAIVNYQLNYKYLKSISC
jgi:ditrans,polycis-polyprenyl diphosphate synthase